MRASSIQKLVQYQQGFSQGGRMGYNPEIRTYACGTIRHGTSRARLPRQIGMPRLPFGMIPGTKPEPLKIAKTEQRARSFAGRDPIHLLAFEMRCVYDTDGQSQRLERLPVVIDTFYREHTINRVGCGLYNDEEINASGSKGMQRGAPSGDIGRGTTGTGLRLSLIQPPPPPPQCTHNSGDVEKLKKKNK
ncbi:hypothetical protein Tco_0800858 [Tanacetum coccineum]|uniref:Uncharacterized protein n=1 Tax=Tanacetum coccineum TaxID=301880 RepID=A0ABQ4ZVA1_9ASTR